MTEPTAEQVNRERERAWQFMKLAFGWDDSNRGKPWSRQAETDVADAFARVRIEAHAAGLEKAERLVRDAVVEESLASNGRVALALHRIADAIRALRGRT